MTRRKFVVASAGLVAVAGGQTFRTYPGELASPENDTFLKLSTEADFPDGFMVAVRTSVKADQALVTVFYAWMNQDRRELLLSKQSLAPIAGLNAYGGTRDIFHIPRTSVKFIEVTFFNEVGKRKIEVKGGKL